MINKSAVQQVQLAHKYAHQLTGPITALIIEHRNDYIRHKSNNLDVNNSLLKTFEKLAGRNGQ